MNAQRDMLALKRGESHCIFRLKICPRCKYGPLLVSVNICLHCDVVEEKRLPR